MGPLAIALGLAAAACGGGGGGGGGGGNPSPVPTIPVATPTPPGVPTPTPTPAFSNVELILREGDTLAGGPRIADIEDAALADDGTIAAVVEIAGSRGARGVARRLPGDDMRLVFSPESDPSLDSSTLEEILVAPGGRTLFQSEAGVDGDRLYLAAGDATQPLAGVAPGVVAPEFRVLGNFSIGDTGVVGFISGGSPCEITPIGETVRVRCRAHLYAVDGLTVEEVEVPGIDLTDQSPTTPQVRVADSGAIYFSVPGAGEEPTIVRYADGELDVVLSADDDVEPEGPLIRPQLNAVNAEEDLLVTTTLAADPGPVRPGVIGVIRNGDIEVIAREDLDDTPEADDVTDLRTVGLDDFGRVLFTAFLGSAELPEGVRRSLRIFDGSSVQTIATEGEPFPGTDLELLIISSVRFNSTGDTAFVAELGRRMPGTVVIEEQRIVLRTADGTLRSILSTKSGTPAGGISDLEIAGLGDDGSILLLAQAEPSGDRALLRTAPPAP